MLTIVTYIMVRLYMLPQKPLTIVNFVGGNEMNKRKAIFNGMLMAMVLVIAFSLGVMSETDNDHSTPDECADCHYGAGATLQPEVVADWEESGHANSYTESSGNTYCANCKSPIEGDPDAPYMPKVAVPASEWQGVTCYACHTPRISEDGVVTLGHELGNYIPGSGDPDTATTATEALAMYTLVENVDDLCVHCHEGSRHESVYTPGFGRNMYKKGVTCVDCHMPEVPNDEDPGSGEHYSHTWDIIPEYSCGVENDDCHVNKDIDWAEKQIEKDNVHLVGYDTGANKVWQDNQGQTKDKDA
jgi:hypothetical protein